METDRENKRNAVDNIEKNSQEPGLEILPDAEKALAVSQTVVEDEKSFEYVTGIKLWVVVASVTLVAFLMMLDTSIIVTVSFDEVYLTSLKFS
jgi:hypothetical protein